MGSPDNRKREIAGRFGTDIVAYSTPLTNFTANTTVYQALGSPWPADASLADHLESVSINLHTAGADADGVMLLKVQKVRGGSGGTVIDVTTTFSVEQAVEGRTYEIPLLATLTPAQYACLRGDAYRLAKINDSATIDTQPVGVVTLEFAKGG